MVLIPAASVLPIDRLHECDLDWVKRTVQRWCRKLPPGPCVSGVVELVLNEDPNATPSRAWVPHANLIVEVVASTSKRARKLMRRAFPVKPDPSVGVYAPYKAKQVYWTLGALRYASKGLQFKAVGRRFGRLDEEGYRQAPRKLPLKTQDKAELAAFLESKEPHQFVVRVGHRR